MEVIGASDERGPRSAIQNPDCAMAEVHQVPLAAVTRTPTAIALP
jgi:hypothetical protein